MNNQQYNQLPDDKKKELLVDAKKMSEYKDDIATYELFQIDNFFVEVSRSITKRFRKILNTYTLEDVPLIYSSKLYSLLK